MSNPTDNEHLCISTTDGKYCLECGEPNTPTDNAWLDELLDRMFAYGVDWTELKEDLECGHSTSVYAGKIKAEIKKELRTTILTHIDTVCREARQAGYSQGYDQGRFDQEMDTKHPQLNPNKDTNQVSNKENV